MTSYFNIPSDFISLTPTAVLAKSRPYLAEIAVFLIFPFGGYLLGVFFQDIIEKHLRVTNYVSAGFFEFIMFNSIHTTFNLEKTLMWSIIVGVTVFVVVIISVCMDCLLAFQKRQIEKRRSNSVPTLLFWNVLSVSLILIAVGGGYFYFYNEGRSLAERADTFYVVKQSVGGTESSDVVYMGNYGDYLVGIPFHRDTKKFESFVILKMPAEDKRLTLTKEKIGQLQPVEVKSAETKP